MIITPVSSTNELKKDGKSKKRETYKFGKDLWDILAKSNARPYMNPDSNYIRSNNLRQLGKTEWQNKQWY